MTPQNESWIRDFSDTKEEFSFSIPDSYITKPSLECALEFVHVFCWVSSLFHWIFIMYQVLRHLSDQQWIIHVAGEVSRV